MKKIGTLNRHLSRIIASMGHTDRLVICDSGLPIPNGSEVVDLALTVDIPRFLDTVRVVLEELQIEGAIVAEEMEQRSPAVYQALQNILPDIELKKVSHEQFKAMTANGITAFIRTGEATPYANIMLISGVTF